MKSLTTAAILATLAAPVQAQRTIQATLDFNALETAVTSKHEIRNRLYSGAHLDINRLRTQFVALNEANNAKEQYSGRLMLSIADSSAGTSGHLAVPTDNTGVLRPMVGVRNTSIPKHFGGFGNIDFVVNDKQAQNVTYFGKEVGKWNAYAFTFITHPYEGKASMYNEVQLARSINPHVQGFSRVEFGTMKPRYLGGISARF